MTGCHLSWQSKHWLSSSHTSANFKNTLWCPPHRIQMELYYTLFFTAMHIEAETNGLHSADDIFKCIFWNENVWIPIKISLKFVPKCPINNIPAMVQMMAWRRPGDKPLSEPMVFNLPTHICVTRPQWVKHEGWLEIPQHLWPTIGCCWFILYLVIAINWWLSSRVLLQWSYCSSCTKPSK